MRHTPKSTPIVTRRRVKRAEDTPKTSTKEDEGTEGTEDSLNGEQSVEGEEKTESSEYLPTPTDSASDDTIPSNVECGTML